MNKKLKYSELEAELSTCKLELSEVTVMLSKVRKLLDDEIKLRAFIAKKVDEL